MKVQIGPVFLYCVHKINIMVNRTASFVLCMCKINAMANRATGKGYENESFYSNTRFQFSGIENIHVMRASLQKLVEG